MFGNQHQDKSIDWYVIGNPGKKRELRHDCDVIQPDVAEDRIATQLIRLSFAATEVDFDNQLWSWQFITRPQPTVLRSRNRKQEEISHYFQGFIGTMATKNWTLLREAILKMNKQRYLSVMQGRNKFTTSTNSRTLYHNTNKVTDTGFQKKEINNPGEGLHRNELAITGKVIRSKSF